MGETGVPNGMACTKCGESGVQIAAGLRYIIRVIGIK